MGRKIRTKRAAAPVDPRPVAELPEHLQVYDAADWLPPGITDPADGHDEAAWQALEESHRRGYQAHLKARQGWHDTHQLPPLRLAGLPPDEPYSPPPNKVDPRDLPGHVAED